MEHVEVLRHMKETIKAIAPSEVAALDAAIAALSAQQPPAEAQPCGCGEATCTVPWEPGCGLGKSEQHVEAQAQGGGEVVDQMIGDLLPCPFCGKANQDRWPCDWLDGSGANVIRCAWCHGAAPMNVWNRRTAPPSAPVGVKRKYPDDGNGDDDAYNRGWNDCLDALAQQPAAVDEAMVERATMTLLGKSYDMAPGVDWRCDRAWTVNKVRKHMRAALTAALAAQPGGSDNG